MSSIKRTLTKFFYKTKVSIYIRFKLVNAMNYNKLLFFIIVLGFSSMSLKAQNADVKEKNQIDFTEIIDRTPVLLETLMQTKELW